MRNLDGLTEQQLNELLEEGNVYGVCPTCGLKVWISPDDPDASFSDLLNHIGIEHPETDQKPATLWPSIKYVEYTQ